jgi:hypothetical protein
MSLNVAADSSVDGTTAGQSRGEVSRLFPCRSVAVVGPATRIAADRRLASVWGRRIRLAGQSATAGAATDADTADSAASDTDTAILVRAGSRCTTCQCDLHCVAAAHRR